MSSMSILFIGKRFYTNRDALDEKFGRIYQLPKKWSMRGASVSLWLLDYYGLRVHKQNDGSLEVLSTPLRSGAWFVHWLHKVLSYFGQSRPDCIVASGDSYIGIAAWILAKILNSRFIFDVYDKYDEFDGYRRPFGFDSFRFLLNRADCVWFASKALLNDHGRQERGDILVPNGIDSSQFRPINKIFARKAVGLPSDVLLVGYFGSMEPDRGVDDLIAAVSLLRARGRQVELILGGKFREGLAVHIPGVRYLGNLPFERVSSYLASCDVLAIPYRRSEFMDSGASNKIAEAISCERPLVVTRTPNFLANFPMQASQLGDNIATPGESLDICRVIEQQLDNPILVDMPEGMDWQHIADKTLLAMEALVKGVGNA